MSEATDRPEHIDLAKLVDARRALEEALDGLARDPTERAIEAARAALYRLQIVNGDWLWEPLEAAARHAEPLMAAEAPSNPTHRRAAPWRLVEDVLAGAGNDQLAEDVQQVIHARQFSQAIPVVRDQVEVFVSTAQAFADEPVPQMDDEEARATWVKVAKAILDKAIDLLTNIAVAAAFTVTAVQLAAQRTILGAADLAEHTVRQIGPALPVLVGITAVAAEAAMGIQLIRDIRSPFDPTRQPDAAADQPRWIDPDDPHSKLERLAEVVEEDFPAEDLADDPHIKLERLAEVVEEDVPAEDLAGTPRQRAFSDAIDIAGQELDAEQSPERPYGDAGEATRDALRGISEDEEIRSSAIEGTERWRYVSEPDRMSDPEDPIDRPDRGL